MGGSLRLHFTPVSLTAFGPLVERVRKLYRFGHPVGAQHGGQTAGTPINTTIEARGERITKYPESTKAGTALHQMCLF